MRIVPGNITLIYIIIISIICPPSFLQEKDINVVQFYTPFGEVSDLVKLHANGRNNSQHCWPTMLGVVASVCMQLYKVTYLAKRSVKLDHIDILLLQKRGWTNYRDYNYINQGDVTGDDSQRRCLAQHSVAMLEQCCIHSKQCRNNVARLCCAKNRRCESSRVTLPLLCG